MRLVYRLNRLLFRIGEALRRRLTGAGWLALAGLIVTGFVGVDMDQSAASQTFSVLFCLFGIAWLRTWFFRERFAVQRLLPRFGSVGEPFRYRISVRHGGARTLAGLELFEEIADQFPTREEFITFHQSARPGRYFRLSRTARDFAEHRRALIKPAALPPLLPRSEGEAHLEILPLRRGPLRFLGARLAQVDPLGLVRAFVWVPRPETVLILPRRYPLPALALPGNQKYQQGGVAFAGSVGESEEFVSLRDYRPGDPLRRVHWRSSARTGRLVVKEFIDEFFVRHALILDTFGTPGQSAAFEEAVSIAASFTCTVDTQESLLNLMFVGPRAVCFTLGRGVARTEQALEILASVQLCREKPFSALEALVLQHAPMVSGCVCIFLAWDEPRRRLVKKLISLGFPIRVLVVTDPSGAQALAALTSDEVPSDFHIVETGKIELGLRAMAGERR